MRCFSDQILKEVSKLGICLKEDNATGAETHLEQPEEVGYNAAKAIEDEELELMLKVKQTKYLKTIKNILLFYFICSLASVILALLG